MIQTSAESHFITTLNKKKQIVLYIFKTRFGVTDCDAFVFPRTAMNWNKGGPGVKRGFGFGGFSLAGKKEEPPLPQNSHTSFGPTGSGGGYGKNQQLPSFYKIGTKRANFDEENA